MNRVSKMPQTVKSLVSKSEDLSLIIFPLPQLLQDPSHLPTHTTSLSVSLSLLFSIPLQNIKNENLKTQANNKTKRETNKKPHQ